MRGPPVYPIFASWPWLLHTGCSLEALDMTVHERNHERGYSRCKRESRLEIRPDPMHDLFEVAHDGQHRQDRLHEDAILPLPPSTQFEVGGLTLGRMEGGITEDNHPSVKWSNEPLKGVIRAIGGGTRPPHDQPPLIEQQTEFPAADPAVIGEAFTADLLRAAPLAQE